MKETEKIIEAFTELAPRYEDVVDLELKRFWGWSYQGLVNEFLGSTPISQNCARILDVATGTGVIPYELGTRGIKLNRIHGLDITMAMLKYANRRLGKLGSEETFSLTCGSAMDMPYKNASFLYVICGLATHHMDIAKLLSECFRVLSGGGTLSITDVGGSLFWKFPGVKLILRAAAFIYFLCVENIDRAMAESTAVSNVRAMEEWESILKNIGFQNIRITPLASKYFWIPAPLLIKASKPNGGESWTTHSN